MVANLTEQECFFLKSAEKRVKTVLETAVSATEIALPYHHHTSNKDPQKFGFGTEYNNLNCFVLGPILTNDIRRRFGFG